MSTSRKFRVYWSSVAEEDLAAIVEFIALDSVDRALEILARLQDTAATLATMPQRGRLIPELQAQGIQIYRELVHPPWRLVYRIAEKSVYVVAVLDSRRNLEDILLERFTR